MKRLIAIAAAILGALLLLQLVRYAREDRPARLARQRIVSLAPSLTEILFELGAGEEVVGVTTYCTYPPEAKQKEKIGDFVNPNIEKIASLKPDLIVSERWTSTRIVARLQELGLRVLETASPASIAEIYGCIEQVGAATGRSDAAARLVAETRRRIQAVEARSNRLEHHPSVYVEIDLPSWTVGRRSFTHEAVELCGGRNIFRDIDSPSFEASSETIAQRNPEIIVSFAASAGTIARRPGWSEIAAVRTGRIIDDFDGSLLSHGNHRIADGMEALGKRLVQLTAQPVAR